MSLPLQIWRLFSRTRRRPSDAAAGPRILAYCASNVGLGHYGRLCRVLQAVRAQVPDVSILLVTDARDRKLAAEAGAAVLSLPGFHFVEGGQFSEEPTDLNLSCRELRNLRAGTLLAAARSFHPDVLFLDTNPHGKRDEVLPLLRDLRRSTDTRVILMMRDIPARPGDPFKLAGDAGRIRKHASFYDRLLLAGDPAFFDTPTALQWPEPVRRKSRFVGFVVPGRSTAGAGLSRAEALRPYPSLDPASPLLVASFGGGWEADRLAPALVQGFLRHRSAASAPAQMLLVTGPALSEESLAGLRRAAASHPGLVVERFVPDFAAILPHADAAILQAGSTVFQILDSDIPILLLCRDYRDPEQEERSRRLATLPGIRVVPPDSISSESCAEWVTWALSQPRVPRATGFSYDGIANAAQEVLQALRNIKP